MVNQYKKRSTESLVRVERKFNNTFIYFSDGLIECVDNEIDDLEKEFQDMEFWRIHPNHLVNPAYFDKMISTTDNRIVLNDGTELPVSRNMVSPILWKKRLGKSLLDKMARIKGIFFTKKSKNRHTKE